MDTDFKKDKTKVELEFVMEDSSWIKGTVMVQTSRIMFIKIKGE